VCVCVCVCVCVWILDLCNCIVKKDAFQRTGSQVWYYQFTKEKGIQWSVDLTTIDKLFRVSMSCA